MARYTLSAEQADAAEQYARIYGVTLTRAVQDALLRQHDHPDLTFEELLILASEDRDRSVAEEVVIDT